MARSLHSDLFEPFVLKIRLGTSYDAGTVLGPAFDAHLVTRRVLSIETAKQGMALELTYRAALRSEAGASELVKALNRLEGVQGITLQWLEAGELQNAWFDPAPGHVLFCTRTARPTTVLSDRYYLILSCASGESR